ncbi:MAG: hypothetical protein GPJ51_07095 [Candidatus Heimdallarchaeota archaeon]|nr:hypothetical protein [Candidatus Heimdallarchaeota archaeon]
MTGDTVGDPFKDTSGPSINTLLVVMSLTASIFMGLLHKINVGEGLLPNAWFGVDDVSGVTSGLSGILNTEIWVIIVVLVSAAALGICVWAVIKLLRSKKVIQKIMKKE